MPIHTAVSPSNSLSPAVQPGDGRVDREKLKKACMDFEALFMARMMGFMRQSIPQAGFLGNHPGREVYQGLMDQELSRKFSQREGTGLGMMIYRQILKREEKTLPVSPGGRLLNPLTQGRSEGGEK